MKLTTPAKSQKPKAKSHWNYGSLSRSIASTLKKLRKQNKLRGGPKAVGGALFGLGRKKR